MPVIKSDVLPKAAFVYVPGNRPGKRIGWVELGMHGYYGSTLDLPHLSDDEAKALVREYNKRLNVTPAQEEAMLAGAMYGWDVPAADPNNVMYKEMSCS